MSCTAEEIAEKRKIAIERLNARKNPQSNNISAPLTIPSSKPIFTLPSKQRQVIASQSSTSFYGKSHTPNNQKVFNSNNTVQSGNASAAGKFKNAFSSVHAQSHPYQRNTSTNNGTTNKLAPVFTRTVTCSCAMVSESRFVVQASAFNEKLIDVFKNIPSKQYDPLTKNWSFSIRDHALVIEKVSALNPHVSIGPIPSFVLRIFNGNPRPDPSRACLDIIEPKLSGALLEFQREGVCFAIDKGGRALIADEMGLGKTYQAIAVADFYKENWPLLICTTATTRDAWSSKIRELLIYVPAHSIVTLQGSQDYIGDARILITSYTMMEKCAEKLIERRFGFIIMDESHTLKNFKAKCTAVAQELAKRAKRVILLSGTPALSRPVELFTQLQMLDKSFFQFKEYSTRYCAGKNTNFGWDASGQSNLPELNLVLAAKFMIRRTKQEVMSQLADKSRETVILDPSLLWKNDDTEEDLNSYAADYSSSKGREREEILFKYYHATAEAKAPAVCAYLKQMRKENQKFIIFAHHLLMLDAISKYLTKHNVDHIRIDGTTRSNLRSELVDRFQTKDNCRAAVLSLKACNAGITLTAAQLVIFAELDWNPSTLAQAESRAHRIGQEGNVIVRYLLAKGTADDIIWTMLQKKQNILNKAGLCNEDFSDSTNVNAPCSAGNIEPYLEKRSSSAGTLDKYVLKEPNHNVSGVGSIKTDSQETAFQSLLDDGEDDDLVGLDF
ncbi:SWI/SNF-related matrix-associated actin-dependent regulator of chromatin subfamily A-like protein 1 [Toxorhynchites rutilus septentrionalis]|uniref:SWI/SNF-related matrix-associated actin-dependent regulator of chromatin subfamily A-like protein 1 n=1 Tax=Toxorhynchites rutilus septentrionalis TaxID=329112 RepID=UPI00247879DC|nr:SWI/SNF-related matrix-associated actin-dependent regulator of chromatin subfamily A-like protein 1 [Toxorhynchites rutilus septentrionalis]